MDARARTHELEPDARVPTPGSTPAPATNHAAVLALQRSAGNQAVTAMLSSRGPQIARLFHSNKKPLDLGTGVGELNRIAAERNLNLTFNAYAERVDQLATEKESDYDFADLKNEQILEIHQRVSKETAPPEKLEENKSEPQKRVEALRKPSTDNRYTHRYARGDNSKMIKALSDLHGYQKLKKVALEDGTRLLTVGDTVYAEESDPFPLPSNEPLSQTDQLAVDDICDRYDLEHTKSKALVGDLLQINLAASSLKAVSKQIELFLTAIKDAVKEPETLDGAVSKLTSAGLYEAINQDPQSAAMKALKQMPAWKNLKLDEPALVNVAESLIMAGILTSPGWTSARTDEEFGGQVGEFLTHQQLNAVMPDQGTKLEEGEQLLQLHSVHFTGNRYRADKLQAENTDACSELDLMTAIQRKAGGYHCTAVGNTKVTSKSAVGAAEKQNGDALAAMDSFIGTKKVELPSDKTVQILVEGITGTDIESGKEIKLKPLSVEGDVTKRTIGATKAPGKYTHRITQTYQQVHTIAYIIRGRMKSQEK